MFEQFQQSLLLMTKLFGRVPDSDTEAMQKELGRIQELNVELAKLQTEVTRRAYSQAASPPRSMPSDPTPLPGAPPVKAHVRTANPAEAIQEYVEERIGALQKERTNRWAKLSGIATGSSCDHQPLR
jgi:hypothetical protein